MVKTKTSPKQGEKRSRFPLQGILGMMIFFYFAFDLILHNYSLPRTLLEAIIAIAGLCLPLAVRKLTSGSG